MTRAPLSFPAGWGRAWLLFVVLGAGCKPPETGLRVVVSYAGPRQACLQVTAAPVGKPAQAQWVRFDALPHLATKTIGVLPKLADGDAIEVGVEAYERGCDGGLVWKKSTQAMAGRPAPTLELSVSVRDVDDDTYADSKGAFTDGQLAGSDCDDTRAEIHPGAVERCNGLDDNCNDVRDEGLPQTLFYRDLDGDAWGNTSLDAGQTACEQPPGYTLDAGDCDDARPTVHPGAVELCNGLDDDCYGGVDDGLHLGEVCDAGNACPGALECGDAGVAVCASPTPVYWYVDGDGDGHGGANAVAILACVKPEVGRVPNGDDCDDENRFIYAGAPELCDGKDNDCNLATMEVCLDAGLKGFKVYPTPLGTHWKAVAPFGRGFTWVVGDNDGILLRAFEPAVGTAPVDAGPDDGGSDGGVVDSGFYSPGFGDGGFFNFTQRCHGQFKAAWAAPSGRLYLGEGNHVDRLEPDGGCIETWFDTGNAVVSMSGVTNSDAGISIFAATDDGHVYRLAELNKTDGGGALLDRTWNLGGGTLNTVAAWNRDNAIAGGSRGGQYLLAHLEVDGGFFTQQVPAPGFGNLVLYSSAMAGPTLGYLGGGNQALFSWDGAAFTLLSGPNPGNVAFSGLAAFGRNSAVLADTGQKVHRYVGSLKPDGGTTTDFWVDLAAAGSASFRALGATAPDDIWVVGDNNVIVHFTD